MAYFPFKFPTRCILNFKTHVVNAVIKNGRHWDVLLYATIRPARNCGQPEYQLLALRFLGSFR